ncbi:MAG: 2-oxoacid:acceptor oxidoreductase family protein [candidate division Zixibacteria bacterium]|nr:2-oxoacid:acceptor oxidoreductase family protein [candidate division Zixibacteria bacterium]
MTEIRISGFGGQGVIRMGYIIGKAASIYDNKFATLTQSFGPEARGSSCSAQVVVSEDQVLYPYITIPNILVAMSQEGYSRFESNLSEDGMLLIDEDLVKPNPPRGRIKIYSIPSARISEELGNKIIANIVMFGFFTVITGLITEEAARKAVANSVPQRLMDLNLKAFERGYKYGKEFLAKQEKSVNV